MPEEWVNLKWTKSHSMNYCFKILEVTSPRREVMVAGQLLEAMSINKNLNNLVTVNIIQHTTPENAPLATEESLEEEEEAAEKEEEDVKILVIENIYNETNGSLEIEVEKDEDEPQHIVVTECEVASIACSKPQKSPPVKQIDIVKCQSFETIMIEHKAQVLKESSLDDLKTSQENNTSRTESDDSSEIHHLFTTSCSVDKKISQDLIITVENTPDHQLKLTEKLPEVLLVAEQLPVRLKAAKNILKMSSKEKEPTAPPYDSLEMEDVGSILTIDRADRATEVAEVREEETEKVSSIEDKFDLKRRPVTSNNESCISPFFIGIYSFLGVLIVMMIGLNFLFGFHLLFFLGLLAVIALFSCVLTEFNDFHNEPD